MTEEEIIKTWRTGLNKNIVAEQYRRRYNQNIKLIRQVPKETLDEVIAQIEKEKCEEETDDKRSINKSITRS